MNRSQASHSNQASDLDFSNFDNLQQISLEKGSKGLGFAIMDGSMTGDAGIYIKTLIPGGPAASVSITCLYLHAGIYIPIAVVAVIVTWFNTSDS